MRKIAIAAVAATLTCGAAQASAIFDFSYDIPADGGPTQPVTAAGTITADETSTPGQYLVTDITGMRNGVAITGLLPATAFGTNDNLLFVSGTHLDGHGISYTVAGDGDIGPNVNIYFDDVTPGYTELSWSIAYTATFNLTQRSAVPEPASWAMMIGGFGIVGASLRRTRRLTASFA